MPRRPALIAALLLAPLLPLRAGEVTPADSKLAVSPDSSAVDTSTVASNLKTSYELDADTSYVGDARTSFGSGTHGDVSEERTRAKFIIAPQYNDGPIYRFGLAYQRYSFGLSKAAPLPDALESASVVVGMDFSLFNSWLIRVEADPGLYGDARFRGFRDFNVPFLIGGSYIVSDTLQWVAGFDVDVNRQLPFIPAIGVHWTINDSWTLNAVLPNPRLEYTWSKATTLYIGGDVDDGTFRVDRGVGDALGRHALSGSIVEYDEIRVGAGFSWKPSKAFTIEMEGGYLPYREFDFHRADTHFSNQNGAPYGQMSIDAEF